MFLSSRPTREEIISSSYRVARKLWQKLPSRFRTGLGATVRKEALSLVARLVSSAPAQQSPLTGSLGIVGFLSATMGLGEGARIQLDLFRRLKLQPMAIDLTRKLVPGHEQ